MTTMIGLPLLSISLFVLAGILIGHLLWYHDRKHDLRRISQLEDRYQRVRSTAVQRKQEFVRLQAELKTHQDTIGQARTETEMALEQLQEAESRGHAVKLQLRQFDQERQTLLEQQQAESRRSESLALQLQEAIQAKAELETRLSEFQQANTSAEEAAESYRARIEQLQQLQQHSTEQNEQELEKLRRAISEQATAAAQTARDKERTILRLKQELEFQEKQFSSETGKVVQQLQDQLESVNAELQAVQVDRERARQALQVKSEECTKLQVDRQRDIQQNEAKLTSQQAKAEQQQQQITQLQQELSNHQERLRAQTAELAERKRQTQQSETLQKRIEELTLRLQTISTEYEDSLQSNSRAEDRIRELQNQLHENASKIRDLRRQVATLGEAVSPTPSPAGLIAVDRPVVDRKAA